MLSQAERCPGQCWVKLSAGTNLEKSTFNSFNSLYTHQFSVPNREPPGSELFGRIQNKNSDTVTEHGLDAYCTQFSYEHFHQHIFGNQDWTDTSWALSRTGLGPKELPTQISSWALLIKSAKAGKFTRGRAILPRGNEFIRVTKISSQSLLVYKKIRGGKDIKDSILELSPCWGQRWFKLNSAWDRRLGPNWGELSENRSAVQDSVESKLRTAISKPKRCPGQRWSRLGAVQTNVEPKLKTALN